MRLGMQPYPQDARKLGALNPGTVIRRVFNDDTPEDRGYYLITDHGQRSTSGLCIEVRLVDLQTGKESLVHGSSKGVVYDAEFSIAEMPPRTTRPRESVEDREDARRMRIAVSALRRVVKMQHGLSAVKICDDALKKLRYCR